MNFSVLRCKSRKNLIFFKNCKLYIIGNVDIERIATTIEVITIATSQANLAAILLVLAKRRSVTTCAGDRVLIRESVDDSDEQQTCLLPHAWLYRG